MLTIFLRKLSIRFLAICFWLCLIVLFLFSPNIKRFFKEKDSLTIFTFPNLLDADYLHKFTKETGIKLYVSYYENNDELLVKMRETGGVGYDIIVPSDYAVDLLIKEGLLQKIDKSKLSFYKYLNPKFLGKYFDPKNEYSIPYLWEAYKIGYTKDFFKDAPPEASWKVIFDEKYAPSKIGMLNNAREAVLLAAYYLFGTIDNLTDAQIQKVKELLVKQKKWVAVYTDLRPDYLLYSGTVPLAVGMSGEIWQGARFDPSLDYVIPKEGTFMVIDSVAIPSKSKKQNLIYKFLEFFYRPDVVEYHNDKHSTFPVITNVTLQDEFKEAIDRFWSESKKVNFFKNVLKEEQLNEVWIYLKSH